MGLPCKNLAVALDFSLLFFLPCAAPPLPSLPFQFLYLSFLSFSSLALFFIRSKNAAARFSSVAAVGLFSRPARLPAGRSDFSFLSEGATSPACRPPRRSRDPPNGRLRKCAVTTLLRCARTPGRPRRRPSARRHSSAQALKAWGPRASISRTDPITFTSLSAEAPVV